jgi:predicted AAA+ superfamily ATPase
MSGKTHTARKLHAAAIWDAYENLADPVTAELAAHDLPAWLASLAPRTIIDEAQLLADLPLQIKFLVDQAGSNRRFLLTGSASIGRTGLGGSDPLTGRVQRWTLAPLTAAETAGHPENTRNLIERLFTGEVLKDLPPAAASPELPQWQEQIRASGFPTLALNQLSTRATQRWIRDMTTGLLTEKVLPDDRFDAGLALRVLDACLRDAAGILNVSSLGTRLGLDPRTVERYLDIMEQRFLLRFLPNLATNPTRQNRARSKIHPVDTAFAFESLTRANPKTAQTATTLGHLLESYVVNQILPCLQFAPWPVEAFYWRHAKTHQEVDLVLSDTEGRRVGIEVKSSSQVGLKDTAGLQALDQKMGLDRSYVVYTGTSVLPLGERCWALPLTAFLGPN